jgi:cyclopropane-fatty-acyl-phospholipid synthase
MSGTTAAESAASATVAPSGERRSASTAGTGSESAPPRVGRADRWLLTRLQRGLGDVPVRLMLWDGSAARSAPSSPVASLVVADRAALVWLLVDPQMAFGELYRAGRLTVEGPLVDGLVALFSAPPPAGPARLLEWLRRLARELNTRGRARQNIHRHYDLGNEFYRRWLDEELVYTCAYFAPLGEAAAAPEPTGSAPPPPLAARALDEVAIRDPDAARAQAMSLEAAQRAKMEYVCRKLRLRPGERVVEAGCGWGALALYMARHYGVTVRAFNISREQVRYARARAQAEGLAGAVEFIEDDYRNITGRYDVFVSVGMLEHVGRPHYRSLGAVIHRVLDPARGRGLLHFIGRSRRAPLHPWIRRRIFPGGYPPTVAEVAARVLEPWAWSILDVENLRLHYARTLAHWLARFEAAREAIRAQFDEAFVRTWRLYLAGSQASFLTGALQLFQIVFARPGDNVVPWTRRHLYPA